MQTSRLRWRAIDGAAASYSFGGSSDWPTHAPSRPANHGREWRFSTRGCRPPELQYWVHEADRQLYRLDLAYPKHRVAVEYDGQEFHLSAEQRAADKFRRDWLRSQGWTIIIVDKNSFSHEAREVWLHCLRAALQLA